MQPFRFLVGLVATASMLGAQTPEFHTPVWSAGYDFSSISSVRVLSDGRLLLHDGTEKRLVALGPTGGPIREIGRVGAGPGEFRQLRGLVALPGDSTALIDVSLKRVQYLDGSLTFGSAVPFLEFKGIGPDAQTLADSRGNLLFKTFVFATTEPVSAQVRWNVAARRLDTVASLRHPLMTRPLKTATGVASYVIPFRPEDGWAIATDGRIVLVRVQPYSVEVRAPGRTPTHIAFSAPRVPVTAADRNGWPTVVLDSIPRVKPPFDPSGIVAGADGTVWIPRHYHADAKVRQWDVVYVATGRHVVRTMNMTQTLKAVTASGVYIATSGPDDLERLEFHRHVGK